MIGFIQPGGKTITSALIALLLLGPGVAARPSSDDDMYRGDLSPGGLQKCRAKLTALDQAVRSNANSYENYNQRARVYLTLGMYQQAIADVTKAITIDPVHVRVLVVRAICLDLTGQPSAAVADLNKVIAKARLAMWIRMRSKCLSDSGKFDQAADDLSSVIETYPGAIGPLSMRAMTYAMAGQNHRAMLDLVKALRMASEQDSTLLDERHEKTTFFGAKFYEGMLKAGDKRIGQKHNDANAYFARAVCFMLLTKYGDSIHDCDAAIRINPNFVDAFVLRGSAAYKSGQHDKAINDFEKAAALAPRDETTYAALANFYRWQNKYETVIENFSKKIKLDPTNPVVLTARARAFSELGDQPKAIADVTNAIKIDPKYAPAYQARGELYQAIDQPGPAIMDFTKAIGLMPSLREAYCQRAACYIEQHNYEKALPDLDKALNLIRSAKLLSARAVCYEKLGRHELAEKDRQEAGKTDF